MALAAARPGPLRRQLEGAKVVHYPLTIAIPPARVPTVVHADYHDYDGTPLVQTLYLKWLRNSRATPLSQLEFACQSADLLSAIHDRAGIIHLDLRLDNFVITENGVGFVDFGLCDRLDTQVRRRQLSYLAAIYSGDQGRIFQALTEILVPSEDTDMEAFRRDFDAETRRVEVSSVPDDAESSQADRSPFATYLIGTLRAARRNRLRVPTRVLAMYRALLTTETIANRLGLRDGVRKIGESFFAEIRRDEIVAQYSDPENLESALLSVLSLTRDAPGQLGQLLSELSDGTFSLATRNTDAPAVTRAKNRRTRLIVSAILSVSVALLLTVPKLPAPLGVPLAWPLTALLVAVYGWTLVQWSRL